MALQTNWIISLRNGPVDKASSATLTDKAKELGVKIMLQTPVIKIVKRGDRVTGVIVEDRSGEQVVAEAGAVIVATGASAWPGKWELRPPR